MDAFDFPGDGIRRELRSAGGSDHTVQYLDADRGLNHLNILITSTQPITLYASTGKIKTSSAFTKEHGTEAAGMKMKGAGQIELIVRESQAGNVVGEAAMFSSCHS